MISPHGEVYAPINVGNIAPCGVVEVAYMKDDERALMLVPSGRVLWVRIGKRKDMPNTRGRPKGWLNQCDLMVEGFDQPIRVIGMKYTSLALALWGYAPIVYPVHDDNGKRVARPNRHAMCLNPFRIAAISTQMRKVSGDRKLIPMPHSYVHFSNGQSIAIFGNRLELHKIYFLPVITSSATAYNTKKLLGLLTAAELMDNSNEEHTDTTDKSQLADDLGDWLRLPDKDLPSRFQTEKEWLGFNRDAT
jgi:hypothetical protein